MPDRSEWSLTTPQKLTFDEPVSALNVSVVNGTVNVVGTDGGPARLELSALQGPPLRVRLDEGTLRVGYDDLTWQSFLKWLDRKGWQRTVEVTLTVPCGTRVEVGTVGAAAVVSGITAPAELRGVTGDTTLVGLGGPVSAQTVSGALEAQALGGDLIFNSVSGDLTLVEGTNGTVRAKTVNGNVLVDLSATGGALSLEVSTVSGDIAIRLPHPVDADVEASTATGGASCAFEDLRVSGQWGAKRITGRLGSGGGSLKATTASGTVAVLRRPPSPEEPADAPVNGKVL
ncbi:DUF4097 family beta strand repeat-containing protein [Streptomyces orinoci]|uniref:DUF4097 family beta strand repeat-containing protein n=1 Tax=Streptomyces orinoci TaxID=67339 RepID=A0ABV3JT39_STRON|nr:DUF4097 family beta strand repeat-containing protein [Streptomyces orinoci]